MATQPRLAMTAQRLLVIVSVIGIVVAVGLVLLGQTKYAPLAAWDAAALIYVSVICWTVLRFSAADTKTHAVNEDPGRALSDIILIVGSIASLIAVGFLVMQASSAEGVEKAIDIALGLLSVVASWSLVHTTYLLKYARLYYGNTEGGIDFNDKSAPRYIDFAYLAFTVGMTFQVSDTVIETKEIRATILRHALLSYLFGTVIIATTINTLASISSGS